MIVAWFSFNLKISLHSSICRQKISLLDRGQDIVKFHPLLQPIKSQDRLGFRLLTNEKKIKAGFLLMLLSTLDVGFLIKGVKLQDFVVLSSVYLIFEIKIVFVGFCRKYHKHFLSYALKVQVNVTCSFSQVFRIFLIFQVFSLLFCLKTFRDKQIRQRPRMVEIYLTNYALFGSFENKKTMLFSMV